MMGQGLEHAYILEKGTCIYKVVELLSFGQAVTGTEHGALFRWGRRRKFEPHSPPALQRIGGFTSFASR